MKHWCGWSPTDSNHIRDSWVQYLQAVYPHLQNLYPILDSLMWPEEIAKYPAGGDPPAPWLFLLATADSFYVYDFENRWLGCAGNSLDDVLSGLKTERYLSWEERHWKSEKCCNDDLDPGNYFPVYTLTQKGNYELLRTVHAFGGQGQGSP